jgi:alcohol dehydrogenase class IV
MTATATAIPTATFGFPTRVVFGPNVVDDLATHVAALKMQRPLVVTDAGMVRAGLLARITATLEVHSVFDGVEGNPTEASVHPGVERYRTDGCDGIVALGGGSALDAAKAIRLAVTHRRPLHEYDDLLGGDRFITADMPPMIAIATTSGTGSEVSRSTVIDLQATGRKTVIFSPHLLPSLVLADPTLTFGLPAHLTAWTGVDALTHNLEAYIARGFHPICDAIAIRGVETIARSLRRAVANGRDEEARADMMIASMMGAVAFQKGLGATHSLAHPLSSVAGLHHGLANAIMLPHVLAFNADAPGIPSRYADLARAMGAAGAIEGVEALLRDVGIPRTLREAGVREEQIETMVPLALQDGCHQLNPRPCTADDFRHLYRAAF